ncbi:MAG: undecaprenyl-phosphate galactose phosphotransferase WbaP [Bryobacteraceae bacterium]
MSVVVAARPRTTRGAWKKLRESPRLGGQCRPAAVIAALVAGDMLSLLVAVAVSVLVKIVTVGPVELDGYLHLWPAMPVFLAVYCSVGLYSVIALSTPEEIRRVSMSSAVVFVVLAAMTVSQRGARSGVTWTLVLAVVLTIALIPMVRSLIRNTLGRRSWWGYPAVMFGSGDALAAATDSLLRNHGGGLIPVAIATESADDTETMAGLPVLSDDELTTLVRRTRSTVYAVVAEPGLTGGAAIDLIERRCSHFPRVILLPPLAGLIGVGVESRSVAGELGLEVSRHIYASHRRVAKDVMDFLLASAALVVLAPLFLLIGLAVLIESGFPVFYGHRRVGRAGESFRAWKFRSMVNDADDAFAAYLAAHPEARQEWEQTHKLRHDPRVSRIGAILRKTSLDELPQLWNVIRGEMSVVGPRPVVSGEIAKYGERIDLYYRVKGGITGLWQVSGRNDTSYEQRVALDLYYIRNWSVWLDLFIMARTVTAVLFRRGAY